MRYLFLFMIFLGAASTSFAMERGGGGRDFNRGGQQHRDFQRQDFDRHHDNWQHRGYEGNINEVIIPQGGAVYNDNAFPDDAEEDQIYEEDLQN